MNIHPIVVHFPIAFLVVYALCELLRFRKIIEQPYWFYLKAFLVIVGILGAFVAYQVGEAIEHLFEAEYGEVMRVHALFARISIMLFGILAVSYFIAWLNRLKTINSSSWRMLRRIQAFVLETPAAIVLAVLGLAAISITGALGAAIAHGPDMDPFVSFVYKIFIGQ